MKYILLAALFLVACNEPLLEQIDCSCDGILGKRWYSPGKTEDLIGTYIVDYRFKFDGNFDAWTRGNVQNTDPNSTDFLTRVDDYYENAGRWKFTGKECDVNITNESGITLGNIPSGETEYRPMRYECDEQKIYAGVVIKFQNTDPD